MSRPDRKPPSEYEAQGWLDKDGLTIPTQWRARPDNWEQLSLAMRRERSEKFLADEAKKLEPPKPKQKRSGGGKSFTTRAAKDWGRSKGWKIVEAESSTLIKTKQGKLVRRTFDAMLGSDVVFDDPGGAPGMILVQAGGKGESKPHKKRFDERGGTEACRRRAIRAFYYVEFDRGNPEPTKIETWYPVEKPGTTINFSAFE